MSGNLSLIFDNPIIFKINILTNRTTALTSALIYLPDGDMMDWSVLPCSKLLSVGRTPDPLVIETWPHWPYRSMTAYTPVII